MPSMPARCLSYSKNSYPFTHINLSSKRRSKHIPHVSHPVLLQSVHPFTTFLARWIQARAESQKAIEAGVRFSSFRSSRFKTAAPQANCTAFMLCKHLAEKVPSVHTASVGSAAVSSCRLSGVCMVTTHHCTSRERMNE